MHPGTGQHPLRKHVFSYDQRDAKTAGDASTVIDEEDDRGGRGSLGEGQRPRRVRRAAAYRLGAHVSASSNDRGQRLE